MILGCWKATKTLIDFLGLKVSLHNADRNTFLESLDIIFAYGLMVRAEKQQQSFKSRKKNWLFLTFFSIHWFIGGCSLNYHQGAIKVSTLIFLISQEAKGIPKI